MNYFSSNTLWHAASVSGTELVQNVEPVIAEVNPCMSESFEKVCWSVGRGLVEDEKRPE